MSDNKVSLSTYMKQHSMLSVSGLPKWPPYLAALCNVRISICTLNSQKTSFPDVPYKTLKLCCFLRGQYYQIENVSIADGMWASDCFSKCGYVYVSLQFNPLLMWFTKISSSIFHFSVGCIWLDIETSESNGSSFPVQQNVKSQPFIREVELRSSWLPAVTQLTCAILRKHC